MSLSRRSTNQPTNKVNRNLPPYLSLYPRKSLCVFCTTSPLPEQQTKSRELAFAMSTVSAFAPAAGVFTLREILGKRCCSSRLGGLGVGEIKRVALRRRRECTVRMDSRSPCDNPPAVDKTVFEKLEIRDASHAGLGLFARQGNCISAGEVVVKVDVSGVLIVGSGEGGFPFEGCAWVGREFWREAEWDVRLSVLLLWKVFGHGGGYAGFLPGVGDLWGAANLGEGELEEVGYGPLVEMVECYWYRMEREWGRFLREVGRGWGIGREEFEWAMKVVHSRALAIPPGGFAGGWRRGGVVGKKFALVPVVDLINHGVGEGVVGVRFDEKEGGFEVVAGGEGVKAGGQLLVNYGGLTNDELYLWYGFVEAGNVNDVFEVEELVEWIGEEKGVRDWNLYEAKVRLLERVGLCYEGRKFYLGRDKVDPYLVAALRVLLADADEFRAIRAFACGGGREGVVVGGTKKEVPKDWFEPINNANERRVWGKIELQCQRLLQEFPTSIELDEEMIILHAASSVPSDPVTSNSLLFRVEKKRILRAAAAFAAEKRVRLEMEVDLVEQSEFAPPNGDLWPDVQ